MHERLRLPLADATPAPANRRRHGRLRVAEVYCSLGEVLDVGPLGLRVLGSGLRPARKGQRVSMTLGTPLGLLPIRGVVTWTRRLSLRHAEIGIALVDVTDEGRRAIAAIAQGCGSFSEHRDMAPAKRRRTA